MTRDVRTPSRLGRAADELWVALTIGLLVGLLDVATYYFKYRNGIGFEVRLYGIQFPWMSPVINAILFVALAGVVLAATRIMGKYDRRGQTWFIYAGVAVFAELLNFHPSLHYGSSLLIAAGIGAVTARRFSSGVNGPITLVRSVGIAGGIVTLAALASAQVTPRMAERRALAGLPPPTGGAPNVLLITLDTVAAHHTSLHTPELGTTPHLEALARRGVVFDRALAATSWTLPSHASLFTGRRASELSTGWQAPLDGTHETLAEALGAMGYATAGFVANVSDVSRAHGLNRGFAHWEDHVASIGQLAGTSTLLRFVADSALFRRYAGYYDQLGRKNATDINAAMLEWVGANRARPFFVFLNYFDAHSPYVPPKAEASRFGVNWSAKPLRPNIEFDWSPEEVVEERAAYRASMARLDEDLGRLFAALEESGTLRRTLVIVTSDHGEEFFEHGIMGHGESLYLQTLHVPLVMTLPGKLPEGRRVQRPVGLADIPATILDLLGRRPASLPSRSRFPGRSMLPILGEGADEIPVAPVFSELGYAPHRPENFPISKGDMYSVLSGRLHYIRQGDGHEELFDIEADPAESRNLVKAPETQAALSELRVQIDRLAKAPAGR